MATPSSYTGHLFEQEVLGPCRLSWNGDYTPFRESLRLVEKGQSGDPSDPESPTMNDLHALIAIALEIEDWSELRFYTALGSPLDQWHGIDGFFVFRGKRVTIDLTINPEKDGTKADLVVHQSELDDLEGLAQKIARRFQN